MDHAQAKINLINAAIAAGDGIQEDPVDFWHLQLLNQLRKAVAEYKKTKQPKRIDEGDEFDSLHGCG